MQLLQNPSRIQLDKMLLVTEYPPWADVAVPYALGLSREHRARMHVAHPVSTHTFQKLTHVPQGGAFRQSWRDLVFEAAARQVVIDREVLPARLRAMAEQHDFDLIIVSFGRDEDCGISNAFSPSATGGRHSLCREHGRENGLDSTLAETFLCSDPLSSIPNPQLQRGEINGAA